MRIDKVFFLLLSLAAMFTACKDEEECNPREHGRYRATVSQMDLLPSEHNIDSLTAADSALHTYHNFYNEKRQLVQTDLTIHHTGFGTTTIVNYTYDACGRLIEADFDKLLSTYFYDDQDRCVRVNHVSEFSSYFDSIIYAGNRIKRMIYNDGVFSGAWYEYEVNTQTQNITTSWYSYSTDTFEYHYVYDDKVNPIRKWQMPVPSEYYSANNLLRKTTAGYTWEYQYTYDEQGYPLTRNDGVTYTYIDL